MYSAITAVAARFRVLVSSVLVRLGGSDSSFLVLLAVLIGVVSALAAVGFHLLIEGTRDLLYKRVGPDFLYGHGLFLLILWPALGGLIVGFISRVLLGQMQGRGIVDVLESVVRTSGYVNPLSAIEKIFTAAITIGSGGSGGAEGPIVQIGAAISAGIGSFFRIPRAQLPIVIGCGCAAGISAIFNAPIGGLLFTLEVILQDFSFRTLTPLVIASVVANVTIQAIFHGTFHIFTIPREFLENIPSVTWSELPNYALLGVLSGVVGVMLTQTMTWTQNFFEKLPVHRAVRPAIGGALLGVSGILYIFIFGHFLLGSAKPIPFDKYPLPAFFGDGYGFIQMLFRPSFYSSHATPYLFGLLLFLLLAKTMGTCFTISSGGAGGIIAPSLFLGAVTGALLGMALQHPFFPGARPDVYALVGMGAVLAAVVHAPLAAALILLELTKDYNLVVPAMLASVLAVAMARIIFRDNLYTIELKHRGISGTTSELRFLQRTHVEQVPLDPATFVQKSEPVERLIELSTSDGSSNFVVQDSEGTYLGMVVADDLRAVLIDRDALPLLLAEELVRHIPQVRATDDLASVLDVFSKYDASHLPVTVSAKNGKIIGLISRAGLLRYYHTMLGKS
jgi:chloride channel protein, CIC family